MNGLEGCLWLQEVANGRVLYLILDFLYYVSVCFIYPRPSTSIFHTQISSNHSNATSE